MTATHPLSGRRIVSTRAEEQSREFVAKLRELGAIPIIFPTIRIAPLEDFRELDGALQRLREYDWVVFTSVNGVRSVVERMQTLGLSPADLNACQVAAIGPATEALLHSYGVQTALRPGEYIAEAIVTGLVAHGPVSGKRFLLLRVDIARAVLREHLIAHGAQVDEIATYQTTTGQPDAAAYAELRAGVNVITFTSSSTVSHFFDLLGDEALPIASRARIACIGPITAQTAHERGLTVDVVAEEYTIPGLIAALTQAFAATTASGDHR